ncbi:MAG: hypothetical protein ACOX3H_05600 [Saccharofermentanales bacterium]
MNRVKKASSAGSLRVAIRRIVIFGTASMVFCCFELELCQKSQLCGFTSGRYPQDRNFWHRKYGFQLFQALIVPKKPPLQIEIRIIKGNY